MADFGAGVAILKESANTGCFCRSNRYIGLREGGVRMIGISVQTALVVVQIRVDSDIDVMPLHHQNWVCGFATLLLCSLIGILVSLFLQY